jgi:hypothetical protein
MSKQHAEDDSILIPCRPAWKSWLTDLATESRLPRPVFVELALCEYAQRKGMSPPPQRVRPRGVASKPRVPAPKPTPEERIEEIARLDGVAQEYSAAHFGTRTKP